MVETEVSTTTISVAKSNGTSVQIVTHEHDEDFVFRTVLEALRTVKACEPHCLTEDFVNSQEILGELFSRADNNKSLHTCSKCGQIWGIKYLDKYGPPRRPVPKPITIDSPIVRRATKRIASWVEDNTTEIADLVAPSMIAFQSYFTETDVVNICFTSQGYMVPGNIELSGKTVGDDIPIEALRCWLLEHQFYMMHRRGNNTTWKKGAPSS